MTGQSIVATTTFHSRAGKAYHLPVHTVRVAADIYEAWAYRALRVVSTISANFILAVPW